ncbi:hypothetical protein GCM10023201_21060 [Actinomycetospora corticicola]|uniref:TY-Chap N-terminal domain-containing protein n=1 Tax=Actinomycetospora corticicola TaxID=663602 RepID=A0A7Y9J3L8_9PSEU|nr:hypothetical protein [Actinomycetospora corticicola]NYD34178.1 hypothetical protein [Actinomycetospora corticicola]
MRDVLHVGHAFVGVFIGRRFVQFHAHPHGGRWVEADSGAYTKRLPDDAHQVLLTLGWPPLDDNRRPSTNYRLDVASPVDVYRLVRSMVRTLDEAFGATPEELGYVASACRCRAHN